MVSNVLSKAQSKKLSFEEADWRLNGCHSSEPAATRTRGGGLKKTTVRSSQIDLLSSDDEAEEDLLVPDAAPEEEKKEEEQVVMKVPKPCHKRIILESAQLEKVFNQLGCPECGGELALNIRTVCIATSIGMECQNSNCNYFFHPEHPSPTTIHDELDDSIERSTDYAVNVLYILGFISMGDGPSEAGRLLGLLGLPNDTTMESCSFQIIEERIGVVIRDLCDEIIQDNLIEEAKLAMAESERHDDLDFKNWMNSLTDPTINLMTARMPHVDGSYDMAWQQKGSGHQYNSQSGHGTLMGRLTRKVIGLVIKSKICNQCNAYAKKFPDLPMPPHKCWKNHDGSSGSMESAACLELVVSLFHEKKCVVARLCCDDYSSIRADCQWSNANYMLNNNTQVLPMVPKGKGINKGKLHVRPDKGKLPADVPEPLFVADPNHRRKGLTGELIKLDTSKADLKATMTRMDSTPIGKNFGYMARTLKDWPEHEFELAAKAVLEHHFDNHDYCGDWCKRKLETAESRKTSGRYYRCKTTDAKLYGLLQQRIKRFVAKDKLIEMAHRLDTNMNEAFNQICTWFAPKNKVFAGSYSLHNRIAFAVGINSLGLLEYFTKLFRKLGITMTGNVKHYLRIKEMSRMKKHAKVRTSTAKKEKNKRKYEKLKEHTMIAKIEFHKRQGTYQKGMNIDDPYGELLTRNGKEDGGDDGEGDGDKKPPAAKRNKKNPAFCEYCGAKDHLTKRSKKCTAPLDSAKKYRKEDGLLLTQTQPIAPIHVPSVPPDETDVLESAIVLPHNDADDCDDFDHQPLIAMPDDNDSDAENNNDLFYEAGTWDSDGCQHDDSDGDSQYGVI